ncbi:MAG: MBL fold metallo-hydrolase [Burkholderiales bacterium]|nr:MBL fold metallo-hydrolase [Burkholderiales bacterium]
MNPPSPALPPGVVVLERGWLSSNNVVVLGRDSAAVVDSGYVTHCSQTVDLVTRVAGGRPVHLLVNTHLHSDHCGGNAVLQEAFPGIRTLIPPGLAAAVRDWDEVALTYEPTGQRCPRFGFDATLEPGGTVLLGDLRWQAHSAPGHDPHSVILFEPESRTLISADALWEHGFGVVFPELEGKSAFAEVAATLEVIERLRPKVVIPGHGRVFTCVEESLARARSRLAAYLADPRRHATHAAKVLLKFKLLELQEASWDDFVAWAEATPYLRLLHERFQLAPTSGAWSRQLLEDLIAGGSARREGNQLLNA